MTAVAICVMLWYIPVITVTTTLHIFVDRWRSLGLRSYLPLYAMGVSLFSATALLMPYLLRVRVALPSYLIPIGLVLLALGLSFLVWSYKTLSLKTLAWVPELTEDAGDASGPVRFGPYRYCRHPVYSAALVVMVSAFLISGVLSLAIPLVTLLALTAIEDRELRARFGGSYEQYSRDAPVLLWPRRRNSARNHSLERQQT